MQSLRLPVTPTSAIPEAPWIGHLLSQVTKAHGRHCLPTSNNNSASGCHQKEGGASSCNRLHYKSTAHQSCTLGPPAAPVSNTQVGEMLQLGFKVGLDNS